MAPTAPPRTGDETLVFRTAPEASVFRAPEISHSLNAHPELRVRIDIRSGGPRFEKMSEDRAVFFENRQVSRRGRRLKKNAGQQSRPAF